VDEFRHAVARAVNTFSTPTYAVPVLAQPHQPWKGSRFLGLQELDIRRLAPAHLPLTDTSRGTSASIAQPSVYR
jgi:hypothetical protein